MMELIFFIAAFLAVVIGTLAGFGASTVFLPVALFFFDFPTALILTAILHISRNIGKLTFFREGINKKLLLVFGIPSVLLTFLGASLVKFTSPELLKFILGVFLLFFVIWKFKMPDFKFKSDTKNNTIGGSLSGFFAGLIGTGGAIRGAFLTSYGLRKEVYIATAASISFAVDLTRIPVYLASGFLDADFYYFIPILFAIAILGAFTGKKLVARVPQKTFSKMVLAAIGLVAIKFIIDYLLAPHRISLL